MKEMEVADDWPGGGESAAHGACGLRGGERGVLCEDGPESCAPCRSKEDAVPVARVLCHERFTAHDIALPLAQCPCWNG